ncbi:membrane-associated tyrosine- and threonine-specific cdc2-inhibitory kinase-like [Asterias rubens]|uniref:membrane-associated tyrosine- and threonine-specific cdc2-inhibitory kinase-like n=1 Tax=Asterias rubens TaxID=7604 RepID=UPI0014556D80|nr:membrane-associated tyrosine- and threonine-specific cdc2-inhibitory kinase-like [Asterias rubens]XP_033628354.1 membrane-associated tyrosine- and threonine-specific cdc2-inhibitory kinase-like [Asterias rubens]
MDSFTLKPDKGEMRLQANLESSLRENGFKSPRPTPKFLKEETTFSQKKHRGVTPRKTGPPRPPLKSVPPVSRLFPNKTREEESRPRAISFRQSEPSVLLLSPHYNEKSRDSFFDQCFTVVQKLGEGSFGEVYKVKCKESGKLYAVKRSRERFKGEADKRRKLEEVHQHETLTRHQNCVEFFKAWAEKGHLYIQTELCQMSLEEYAESHHDISESTVWGFLLDLIKGVKHLHDHDLLHLDIKPDNIFVSVNGVCKLGDFGLTIQLGKNDLTEAQEGDPRYLAPELLQGKFGKHADVFSIGITILELACDLDLPQNGQLWHQLRHGDIPWEITEGISKGLRDMIASMMNPDYSERPTLQDLLDLPIMRSVRRRRYVALCFRKMWIATISCLSLIWGMLVTLLFIIIRPLSTKLPESSPTVNHKAPQRPLDWDLSFSDDECFETDVSQSSYGHSLAHSSFSSDDEKSKLYSAAKEYSSCSTIATSGTPFLTRSHRRTPLLPRSSSPIVHGMMNNSVERWTPNGSPNISALHDEIVSPLRLSFDEPKVLNKSALEPKNLMQIFDDAGKD